MREMYEKLSGEERRRLDAGVDIVAGILTVAYFTANHLQGSQSEILQTWIDFRDSVGNIVIEEL